jgi:hypothetical protein
MSKSVQATTSLTTTTATTKAKVRVKITIIRIKRCDIKNTFSIVVYT